MTPVETIIEAVNITAYSGDYRVLKDISVCIPAHRFTVIVGPTGCGKSTLLKVLAGICFPDAGTIFMEGRDLHALPEKELLELKKKNGFVFQDAALWQNKTIFENLSLPLSFHFPALSMSDISAKICAALEEMDLMDSINLRPAQLSTGEQKMISFIRALITGPSLLFLDEPTTPFDPAMRRRIVGILLREKRKGTTIIAVTHDNEILTSLADYFILLRNGLLVQAGSAEEIKTSTEESAHEIIASSLTGFDCRPIVPPSIE